jgi:3-oxoacyl-[acyl-carrier protein] reductase
VIGGTGGIGRAIVREFATRRWKVAFTYNHSRKEAVLLRNLVNSLGRGTECFRLRLDPARRATSFPSNLSAWAPRLDALVMCQGVLLGKSLNAQTLGDINRTVQVNLVSEIYLTQLLLPRMARESSITYLSSISAFTGSYDPVYAATKGALISFCKSVARQFAPGIRANVVAPGLIQDTSMSNEMNPPTRERHRKLTLLQRLGEAEDVARTVYFLASSSGRHITGATFDVNGGEYLR